jgi:hypothetical protein
MPKTKRKNRRRDIKTKRMAGFAPQTVARQLAAIEEQLSTVHVPVQLRIDLINFIENEELREVFKQYENYRENLQANNLYNYRFIPTLLMDLIRQLNQVLDKIAYLIRLDDELRFFEQEVRIKGIDYIRTIIESMFRNIDILDNNIQLYEQNLRDEYTKAELGIVNKTNRRADAITRHPDSVRTIALTRRIRSH